VPFIVATITNRYKVDSRQSSMITLENLKSPAAAERYFRVHLSHDNSRLNKDLVPGRWIGNGAGILVLSGPADRDDFYDVLNNRYPGTKTTLRPRASKICATDMCYSAPKSVSIMSMIDPAIEPLVLESVVAIWPVIVAPLGARERRGIATEADWTRPSLNVVATSFAQSTSRANEPNLHVHNIVHNLCFDDERQVWLALDNRPLYSQQKFIDWAIHNTLAANLRKLGYETQSTEHGFEIIGVSEEIRMRFSTRRRDILATVANLDEEDQTLRSHNVRTRREDQRLASLSRRGEVERRQMANLLTRPKKLSPGKTELRNRFVSRLSPGEQDLLDSVVIDAVRRRNLRSPSPLGKKGDPATTIAAATGLAFANRWIIPIMQLLIEAIRLEPGQFTIPELRAALEKTDLVKNTENENYCVVKETAKELGSIKLLIERNPSAGKTPPDLSFLSQIPIASIAHSLCATLTTSPRIASSLRTGSDAIVAKLLEAASNCDQVAIVELPSNLKDAEIVHPKAASASLETLEADAMMRPISLIVVPKADEWLPRDLLFLLSEIDRIGARCLLLDQGRRESNGHNLIRFLEAQCGLDVVSMPPGGRSARLRQAGISESFVEGDVFRGIAGMDAQGKIREITSPGQSHDAIADEYIASLEAGRTSVVITSTEAESRETCRVVRQKLRARRKGACLAILKGKDVMISTLVPTLLGASQRHDPRNYRTGMVAIFDQNCNGITKGDILDVVEIREEEVWLGGSKTRVRVEPWMASRFSVYRKRTVALAKGDRVIATRSRMAHRGGRVTRGRFYEVTRILPNGSLELNGSISFAPGHATVSPGYAVPVNAVVTPLRVHDVILSSSGQELKFAGGLAVIATAMTAAKESVSLYTDSLASLLEVLNETKPHEVIDEPTVAAPQPLQTVASDHAATPSKIQPIKRPNRLPEPAAKGRAKSQPRHSR